MIIVDENFVADQRGLLRSWRIPFRQPGIDVGRLGMQDDEIIPLLLQLPDPTFFTRDIGWGRPKHAHRRHAIVVLEVRSSEAAMYTRRVLRHPDFNSAGKRLGLILRASHEGITAFSLAENRECHVDWA